jgi:hypothetical protein
MLIRVISILLISISLFAQVDSVKTDSICSMRGHIRSSFYSMTLMGWEPTVYDYPDYTMIISSDPNYYTFVCLRCGSWFSEYQKPDTVIVWRKK